MGSKKFKKFKFLIDSNKINQIYDHVKYYNVEFKTMSNMVFTIVKKNAWLEEIQFLRTKSVIVHH